MAADTIYKSQSSLVYDSLVASIKLLAGVEFKLNTPFIYNDGQKNVACLIQDRFIHLMYNEE